MHRSTHIHNLALEICASTNSLNGMEEVIERELERAFSNGCVDLLTQLNTVLGQLKTSKNTTNEITEKNFELKSEIQKLRDSQQSLEEVCLLNSRHKFLAVGVQDLSRSNKMPLSSERICNLIRELRGDKNCLKILHPILKSKLSNSNTTKKVAFAMSRNIGSSSPDGYQIILNR
ncbi:fatty acid synthase [Acrasis kona]|uniref:Fatty acid synthase n=1 Tax=Acrasis kona TaxID=1008807 RepID=A0AAW2ZPI8_9EUKA